MNLKKTLFMMLIAVVSVLGITTVDALTISDDGKYTLILTSTAENASIDGKDEKIIKFNVAEGADEDATEWQANYLAKAILMPNGQVKRCFYALRPVCRSKSEFVCKMAEIFEVSKQAMEIRLKEFVLI